MNKTKSTHTPGLGIKCPRCEGPKPIGACGVGISMSRRGKAYICSPCGTEEAMVDFSKGAVPSWVKADEDRLLAAIAKAEGK